VAAVAKSSRRLLIGLGAAFVLANVLSGRASVGQMLLYAAPFAAIVRLLLSGRDRRTAGVSMVTGAAGTSVKVRMLLSSAAAKKLTLASRTRTLDAQGAALFSLTPSAKARKAISTVKVTVEAVGGGVTRTASGVYVG
jgi:hypothetical protein